LNTWSSKEKARTVFYSTAIYGHFTLVSEKSMVLSFCAKDQVFLIPLFSLNLQSVPLPQQNCGQVLVPEGWVQSLNLGAEGRGEAAMGSQQPQLLSRLWAGGGPHHPGDHSLAQSSLLPGSPRASLSEGAASWVPARNTRCQASLQTC